MRYSSLKQRKCSISISTYVRNWIVDDVQRWIRHKRSKETSRKQEGASGGGFLVCPPRSQSWEAATLWNPGLGG